MKYEWGRLHPATVHLSAFVTLSTNAVGPAKCSWTLIPASAQIFSKRARGSSSTPPPMINSLTSPFRSSATSNSSSKKPVASRPAAESSLSINAIMAGLRPKKSRRVPAIGDQNTGVQVNADQCAGLLYLYRRTGRMVRNRRCTRMNADQSGRMYASMAIAPIRIGLSICVHLRSSAVKLFVQPPTPNASGRRSSDILGRSPFLSSLLTTFAA